MPTTIRLPKEIEKRLSALVAKTGKSKAQLVRSALTEYIADLEDKYLAEHRVENVRTEKSRTYTLEEVEKRLDLDD
jgi:RHH-type rel operon transcriptional repressor/antitoxin RelB